MNGWSPEVELLGAAVGVCALGGAGVLALGRQTSQPRVVREVGFGTDLGAAQVQALLDVVAGFGRGRELRCQLRATPDEIAYGVIGSAGAIETLERATAAITPGLRLSPPAESTATATWEPHERARGAVVSWAGSYPLLRTSDPETGVAGLLGALSGLYSGEAIWLQVVLAPAGPVRRPTVDAGAAPSAGLLHRLFIDGDARVGSDAKRAVLTKFAAPLLRVRIVVAVQAGHPRRAQQLVARAAGALRTRAGARGRLQVRARTSGGLQRAWKAGAGRGNLLTPAEAVGLLAWPVGAPALPELRYGLAPRRLADRSIPSGGRGRTFGASSWPGAGQRLVVQPWPGANCHSLLLGPSGSGKSWLLAGLFLDQIAGGDGALLLDMKGDTALDVLGRLPTGRRDQVLVVEPGNGAAVPGLRSFAGPPELAADVLLSVFRGLYPQHFGIRSERYLRMAFQSLPHDPEASLADAPRLLADPGYRRSVVARLSDPLLLGQWSEFEALPDAQKAEHLASPMSKLAEVLSRQVVRTMLAQARPKLTIAEAIERGMVVVASFAPGRLGAPAAQLLGALVVYEVYQAVMARQALDAGKRRAFGFYVDEPAVLGRLPVPLDSLFETARGMGCGVTMAAQSLTQLPAEVQRAAITNAATIAAFRPGADDAKRIAKELPGITADELQQLDPFQLALRLGLAPGRIAPVCTIASRPLREATADVDAIRRDSAQRFGRVPDEVDAELRRRHGLVEPSSVADDVSAAPLGERRRPS